MNGKQELVAVAGLALVGLDLWKGKARHDIGGILTANPKAGAIGTAHRDLVGIAAELIFVGALVLIAGMNDQLGTAAIAIIVALFVLWLMLHTSSSSSTNRPASAMPPNGGGGNVAGAQPGFTYA